MIGEELLRWGIRRGRRTTRRELKRDGGADHVPLLLERWGLRQEQVETREAAHLRNWVMKGGGQQLLAGGGSGTKGGFVWSRARDLTLF